jgi:hypothetical protein
MPGKTWQIRILVLLLAVAFLVPQLHACADWNASSNSNSVGSHFCPLCSAAAPAVIRPVQGIAIIPIFSRLEKVSSTVEVFSQLQRSTPSRAPPSV